MHRIEELMKKLDVLPDTRIKICYKNGEAEMKFQDGRHQIVRINRQEDRYVFISLVLGRSRVKKYPARKIAETMWDRNRHSDVIGFSLDKKSNLVGRVEHMAAKLDPDELYYYLRILAEECDRLEYLLTGKDKM